jgi:6,7-dimethyl-8-ribityllumazine synthase
MARFESIAAIEPNLNGAGLRIGVAMARFNPDIGEGLLSACKSALVKHGVRESDVLIVSVPGALELPLVLQSLAQSGGFDALIALGAVVRGETYHFEIVSNESAAGITNVQLDTGIPIANGVLTCDTDEQAQARMQQKGTECAQAAIEMANLLRSIAERAKR